METMQAEVPDIKPMPSPKVFPEGASTRYLCAGTYLDDLFRDWILKHVYTASVRRVAPSYGFDLVPVVAHARNAWLMSAAQNGCLTALLVIGTWYAAPSMAFLCTVAYLWFLVANVRNYAVQRMARLFRLRHRKDPNLYQESMHLAEERRRIRESSFIALLLIGGTFVLMVGFHWGIDSVLLGTVPVMVLAGAVYCLAELGRFLVLHGLRHGVQTAEPNRRLETIGSQQRSRVVAYFDNPFIGSGQIVHTWAFTQRLLRPQSDAGGLKGTEFASPPFRTRDLVRHIRGNLLELSDNGGQETEIPGLEVSDLLLVEGRHLGRYKDLLLRTPELEEFEKFMADSRDSGRHHLACRVVSWGGEIVTTVYLHVSLQGGLLYLRYSIYALTPTPESFQIIDEPASISRKAITKAVLRKATRAPHALLAPREFWRALRTARKVFGSPKDRTIDVHHNIGAMVSAREHLTKVRDRSYFQALDVAKHSKIIERRIISSVGEFLKGKVMTNEYEERTTYILNTGVLNMGSGDVSIGDSNTVGGNA